MTDKVVGLEEARKRQRGKGGRRGKIERDRQETLGREIERLNKEFALVVLGGKALVLFETTDAQHLPLTEFWDVATFRLWMETQRFYDEEDERFIGLGQVWLKSPERRQYRGVSFSPEGAPKGFFNLWRGFAVDPAPRYPNIEDHKRHFPTLDDHIQRNVARGVAAHARYIYAWWAQPAQDPTVKAGVSLVLRGGKGAGKSKVSEAFGSLWGRHDVKVSDPRHLTGTFNAHMVECMILRVEEGFWAGDHAAESRLKDLITSDVHLVERKNIDAVPIRNLIRLIITGNPNWLVPASFDERRFAVFDVAPNNQFDHAFFQRINDELDHGGREHLLAYLLALELKSHEVHDAPATDALLEQKFASMDEQQAWFHSRLYDGRTTMRHAKWADRVSKAMLYDDFLNFAEKISKGRRPTPIQFGIALKQMVPADGFQQDIKIDIEADDGQGDTVKKRVNGYVMPDLAACRAHFAALMRQPIAWPAEDEPAAAKQATDGEKRSGSRGTALSGDHGKGDFELDDDS